MQPRSLSTNGMHAAYNILAIVACIVLYVFQHVATYTVAIAGIALYVCVYVCTYVCVCCAVYDAYNVMYAITSIIVRLIKFWLWASIIVRGLVGDVPCSLINEVQVISLCHSVHTLSLACTQTSHTSSTAHCQWGVHTCMWSQCVHMKCSEQRSVQGHDTSHAALYRHHCTWLHIQ